MKISLLWNWAVTVFLAMNLLQVSLAREWVSVDGRTLIADFVSATETDVTLMRLSDKKEFVIPLSTLSDIDQKWVADNNKVKADVTGDKGSSGLRLGSELELEPEKKTESPYTKMFTGDWAMAEYRDLPYAIYAGAALDPSKKYPLILGLHGKSDNNENGKQTEILGKFTGLHQYEKAPAILVAPLCFQPYGATGSGWDDKPGKLALNLINDIVKKTPLVDKSRVYILGHSMGGGGTVSLLTNDSSLFAAGIVISGWADASAVNVFRKVPVWAFHGADDDAVSPERMQAIAKKLKRSDKFRYTEYPGEGHGITGKVFDDEKVLTWLFEQKRD